MGFRIVKSVEQSVVTEFGKKREFAASVGFRAI
jgi:hypothetical protein